MEGAEGTIDNEPWFVGKYVATALGYKNTKDALATHIESCDKIMGSQNATPSITDSMGRTQHPTWINESGLYATFTDFQNKQMLKNDLEFRVSLMRA